MIQENHNFPKGVKTMKNKLISLCLIFIFLTIPINSVSKNSEHYISKHSEHYISKHSVHYVETDYLAILIFNTKSCKIKLCGCLAEAYLVQSDKEFNYTERHVKNTLELIESIPAQLEPAVGEIMDNIVLVSSSSPYTNGYVRPHVKVAVKLLFAFTMEISDLQNSEKDSKEYKSKLKILIEKYK